jgi:hypothetical protein
MIPLITCHLIYTITTHTSFKQLQHNQRFTCCCHIALESETSDLTYNFNIYLLLIPNKENHISVFFILLDFFVRSFTHVRHRDSRSLEPQTALLKSSSQTNKLCGLNPRANYTDQVTTACRRSLIGPHSRPTTSQKSGSTRNRIRTSGSVARNSDHETTEAVKIKFSWQWKLILRSFGMWYFVVFIDRYQQFRLICCFHIHGRSVWELQNAETWATTKYFQLWTHIKWKTQNWTISL